MTPLPGFILFLALTLLFLGIAVATGMRAARKWHLASVACAFGGLAGTVHYAYGLGRIFDLESAGWITPVHLWIAKVTTVAYLLPVVTGVRTIFHPRTRSLHKRVAWCVLALTVLSAITGTWMLLASEPFETARTGR